MGKVKFWLIGLFVFLGLVAMTGCNADDNADDDLKQHRITIINHSNYGRIYPGGQNDSIFVSEGDDFTFTIKANDGYSIDKLIVDGQYLDAAQTYTFSDINCDHTIGAEFRKKWDIESIEIIGIEIETEQSLSQLSLVWDRSITNFEYLFDDNYVTIWDGSSVVIPYVKDKVYKYKVDTNVVIEYPEEGEPIFEFSFQGNEKYTRSFSLESYSNLSDNPSRETIFYSDIYIHDESFGESSGIGIADIKLIYIVNFM